MKRVLVTGANGFIGRNTIALLVHRGYEVHAAYMHEPGVNIPRVYWHPVNLLNNACAERLVEKVLPTHLLHFAWYAEPGKYWLSKENFRWLEASISLLRYFHEFGGQRVVMAGTCAEYDWDYGFCSEALTPCKPTTPYGVCKNALQQLLCSYSKQVGISSAWGRIFFIYGPNENPIRLVASVITSLLRGEVARCTHGNQIRDFMHVQDVASAFVALLDCEVKGVVNIASGRAVTLMEIVLTAANCLRSDVQVQFGAIPVPVTEVPLLVADTRRLIDEVGWKQKYDIRAGIEQTIQWWKSCIDQIGA